MILVSGSRKRVGALVILFSAVGGEEVSWVASLGVWQVIQTGVKGGGGGGGKELFMSLLPVRYLFRLFLLFFTVFLLLLVSAIHCGPEN